MIAKTCPKCGDDRESPKDSCSFAEFQCGTLMAGSEIEWQAPDCIRRQRDALERRVRELVGALQNMMVFDTPIRRLNFPGEFYDEACASARSALEKKVPQ